MTDPLQLTALEQAACIRRGDVSSVELTRFYLDRIDRLDGELNSFVTVLRRRALLAARLADRRCRSGDELPTFHGVPMGIKDLVPMFATRTQFGSRSFRYFVSPMDVPVARRIKRGGFVVLGKLATSEFGVLPVTEPDIHPPTRNPWDLNHTPGGSSGGSGSAVAAGLCPIAHGSDGGGSVRIPAAFCHLFGFKPSLSLLGNLHGRVNRTGMSVMGPLCHSVEDGAAMLDVMRGDAHSAARGNGSLADCRREPKRMRVRMVVDSPLGAESLPPIVDAVRSVAAQLEALGHEVEQVDTVRGDVEEFLPLWMNQMAAIPVPFESKLQPVTQWLRREGRGLSLDDVARAQKALTDKLAEQFGDADILLSPTVGITPPRVGFIAGMGPREAFDAVTPCGAFTAMFNVAQSPASTIPVGLLDGLPFGVQLGGRRDQDADVLALSRQLERAMPWRQRKAPLFERG